MQLRRFSVLHQSKLQLTKDAAQTNSWVPVYSNGFFLETCQRRIWIFEGELKNFLPLMEEMHSGFELFRGVSAYRFLLRVATGLESRVVGETDIFGQIKEAWKKFEAQDAVHAKSFDSVFRRLFEDTKEIRSNYLQQLGGQSYGTLVRKLLKDQGVTDSGSVLVLGAGLLAKSVAPLLIEHDLFISNRSHEVLSEFTQSLQKISKKTVNALYNESEEIEVLSKVSAVVVCVPNLNEKDQKRIQALQLRKNPPVIIHLGVRAEDAGAWKSLNHFFHLENLFDLQKTQDEYRRQQIERATHACEERVRLRSLGGSLSIPHGWEDLALFA